jgi:O-antigen/teichoic acid export membrane protein
MAGVARSVAFSVVGFAWPVVLLLLTTPLVLRGLGDAAYGVWALVGNIVGYLAVLNTMQTAGTKYLAEFVARGDDLKVRRLLGTSLGFNVAVGVLGAVAVFALARPLATRWLEIPVALQPASVAAFRIAALGFLLNALWWWGAAILAGLQRFDWLTGVTIAATTISTAGTVYAVEAGYGVVGVAVATVCGTLTSVLASAVLARRLLGTARFRLAWDATMLRSVLAYGWFSTAQVVFGVLVTQLDRTLLGAWVGVAAVAVYSVPLSVATRIHQLAARALEVVFPLASGLVGTARHDDLVRLYTRAQTLNTALVVALAVPLAVLARELLGIWLGPAFAASAAPVLQLLVVAYALLGLGVVAAAILAGSGRPGVNTAFVAALGVANSAGYWLLIPRWGAVGAAAASAAASALCVPPVLWFVTRRVVATSAAPFLTAAVLRPAAAGVLVAGALAAARPLVTGAPSLIAALALSAAAYIAASVALGVWTAQERLLLVAPWARLFSARPTTATHE